MPSYEANVSYAKVKFSSLCVFLDYQFIYSGE